MNGTIVQLKHEGDLKYFLFYYFLSVSASILNLYFIRHGLLLFPLWSIGLFSQFLGHLQSAGLLGRVISSSQGLYLNTRQHKHRKTHTGIKHPCPEWDSNHEPGFRASEGSTCPRPLDYGDRPHSFIHVHNLALKNRR
jgi:hypothetical protein